MFHELRQSNPSGSIHVEVVFVLNEFLIDSVGFDPIRPEAARQKQDEVVLELLREVGDVSTCVFAHSKHLTKVSLRLGVALETVLVSTLFLADLTVPSQPLKPFRLHLVGDVLGCSNCS